MEEVTPQEQMSLEDVHMRVQKELTEKKEKQLQEALTARLREKAQIEVYWYLNFARVLDNNECKIYPGAKTA